MDINYSEILCNDNDEEDSNYDELNELRNTKEGLTHHKDFFGGRLFNALSGDSE